MTKVSNGGDQMGIGSNRRLVPAREPDYAIPPGETLRDVLDELGMTQAELAVRTGLSPKHVNQVLHGIVPVSADVAQRLEYATGVPARLWNRLEADYRSIQLRLMQRDHLAEAENWLRDIPVRHLVQRGALPAEPHDTMSRVQQALAFFGVASPDAWHQLWSKPAVAYRQSTAYTVLMGALTSWLRLGELAVRDVSTQPFNRDVLIATLTEARAWTRQPIRTILPQACNRLAAVGVVLMVIPEVPGARVFGVTRWFGSDRVLIQLSARGNTEDAFWETFFHEIGHVVLHPKRDVYVELDNDNDLSLPPSGGDTQAAQEREAWAFATRQLFRDETLSMLDDVTGVDEAVNVADSLGIAPGIVAARLQALGRWTYRQGRSLRRTLPPLEQLASAQPVAPVARQRARQPRQPSGDNI